MENNKPDLGFDPRMIIIVVAVIVLACAMLAPFVSALVE